MQALRELLASTLLPLLRPIEQRIDEWLTSLPPVVARGCAVGLFLLAAVWVLSLKREFIYRGAPSQARWRDLRIWAILVLLPYVVIYALL